MPPDNAHAPAVSATRQHVSAFFWAVAFAFLLVMASATVPSPLYGLYRARDHLSAIMITVIYAIFAGGTIAVLLQVPSIAGPRRGRRGVMLGAVATMMAAAALLAAWKALPGLLVGRLLTGVAVGLAAGTAITYLIQLASPQGSERLSGRCPEHRHVRKRRRARGRPARRRLSRPVGAAAADLVLPRLHRTWSDRPDRPGGRARDGRAESPGDGEASGEWFVTLGEDSNSRSSGNPRRLLRERAVRRSLRPLPCHHPPPLASHALAGATLFLVFSAGVISQLATARLQASRVLTLGTISMLVGLTLLVTAVRLSTPSLALFLVGGALIGAGAGAVFKGTTGLVLEAAAPENRLAMTSALLIALFVGLSVPVIGAGVALNRGATAPYTVLGFAILVALGVGASGWALLGRRPRRQQQAA